MFKSITKLWANEQNGWDEWYLSQQSRLRNNEEIEPPWVTFPNSSPIFGWNQGYQEEWKNNIWSEFWRKMSEPEKNAYLKTWQPPSQEWFETITIYWISKNS